MVVHLTKDERVELVFMYGRPELSCRKIAAVFNENHADRPHIAHTTVLDLINRFKKTGSVHDLPRSGRSSISNDDETATAVLGELIISPMKSTRKLAQQTGVSRRCIQKILKVNHFHPYKVQLVQELHGDDYERRMKFCEWVLQQPDIVRWIMFSDEAIFHLSGHVNRHNSRYWADENPHWMEAVHVQNDPRIMVWGAIWYDRLIGPYFFDGNVTGESYLHMLQTFLMPILNVIPLNVRENIMFQEDGAPPHFSIIVRNFKNAMFPNRWIGRRGHVEWPPRSPDYSPLDYFLWGHLKSVVYVERPRNIEQLMEKIRLEFKKITVDMLRNVANSFVKRIEKSFEVGGEQFEHLL